MQKKMSNTQKIEFDFRLREKKEQVKIEFYHK